MVGDEALEPGEVGDLAVAHRHVEVGAEEDALAVRLEVVERAEGHACSRPSFGSGLVARPSPNPLPEGGGDFGGRWG